MIKAARLHSAPSGGDGAVRREYHEPCGQKDRHPDRGDFYEKEIFYYEHRFAEEGVECTGSPACGAKPLTFSA